MATTSINVKCNFTSVFAKYNTIEDIKELGNILCKQVQEAYEARFAELNEATETIVEVEVEAVAESTTTPTQPKDKKSATAKAKEAAERFKKEAAKSKTEDKPKPKLEKKPTEGETLVAITDTKAIKALGLTFETYNEKCCVLRGDTKPLRKVLKEQFKGVYNSRLTGGEGWIFRNANAEECAKALGLKIKNAA